MSSSSKRDLLIVACAVSAGVHAALAPAHFQESFVEGAGFVAATAVLAVVVGALAFFPASRLVVIAAAFVFAGLLVSYAFAAATGIPLLHPPSGCVARLHSPRRRIAGVAELAPCQGTGSR